MKAKSIKGTTVAEISNALNLAMADGFTPTLAMAFASVTQDRDGLSDVLDAAGISICGSTTNGEFIDDQIGKGSIAILLLDINRDYFEIYYEEFEPKNDKAAAEKITKKALERYPKPAFLITGSHMETEFESVLEAFETIAGKDVNVFGGMAGDDFSFTTQYAFTNGWSSSRGLLAVVLNEDKIKIRGIATCGWKPVGTDKIVTRSERNHIYTVADVPVLDITAKYGGIENVTPENTSLILDIATQFPLQLQRDMGDPVMRPGLIIDWEDHSFYTVGSVPEGSRVRFSLPPDFDVIEKVIKGCEGLKATEMPEADALIVYSCAGRLVSLGPMIGQEIDGVSKVWNVPMAGMFSNAEFGRATGGKLELHGLTTCCVALKET